MTAILTKAERASMAADTANAMREVYQREGNEGDFDDGERHLRDDVADDELRAEHAKWTTAWHEIKTAEAQLNANNLYLICPMGTKISAGEWGLGDGTTYCVVAESPDSHGKLTYTVLSANITALAAIMAAKEIKAALEKAARTYVEPR